MKQIIRMNCKDVVKANIMNRKGTNEFKFIECVKISNNDGLRENGTVQLSKELSEFKKWCTVNCPDYKHLSSRQQNNVMKQYGLSKNVQALNTNRAYAKEIRTFFHQYDVVFRFDAQIKDGVFYPTVFVQIDVNGQNKCAEIIRLNRTSKFCTLSFEQVEQLFIERTINEQSGKEIVKYKYGKETYNTICSIFERFYNLKEECRSNYEQLCTRIDGQNAQHIADMKQIEKELNRLYK